MSYQALINQNLDKAFTKIKDLAIDVDIVKNNASFDFGNGTTTLSEDSTTNIKAVVIDMNKNSQNYDYLEQMLLFKSEDFIDITAYDTVTIGSEEWKIGTRINNSGFIYLVNIYRQR